MSALDPGEMVAEVHNSSGQTLTVRFLDKDRTRRIATVVIYVTPNIFTPAAIGEALMHALKEPAK